MRVVRKTANPPSVADLDGGGQPSADSAFLLTATMVPLPAALPKDNILRLSGFKL